MNILHNPSQWTPFFRLSVQSWQGVEDGPLLVSWPVVYVLWWPSKLSYISLSCLCFCCDKNGGASFVAWPLFAHRATRGEEEGSDPAWHSLNGCPCGGWSLRAWPHWSEMFILKAKMKLPHQEQRAYFSVGSWIDRIFISLSALCWRS